RSRAAATSPPARGDRAARARRAGLFGRSRLALPAGFACPIPLPRGADPLPVHARVRARGVGDHSRRRPHGRRGGRALRRRDRLRQRPWGHRAADPAGGPSPCPEPGARGLAGPTGPVRARGGRPGGRLTEPPTISPLVRRNPCNDRGAAAEDWACPPLHPPLYTPTEPPRPPSPPSPVPAPSHTAAPRSPTSTGSGPAPAAASPWPDGVTSWW